MLRLTLCRVLLFLSQDRCSECELDGMTLSTTVMHRLTLRRVFHFLIFRTTIDHGPVIRSGR